MRIHTREGRANPPWQQRILGLRIVIVRRLTASLTCIRPRTMRETPANLVFFLPDFVTVLENLGQPVVVADIIPQRLEMILRRVYRRMDQLHIGR